MVSKLEFYSFGYVANDKDVEYTESNGKNNSWFISVYPIENLPNRKGDMRANEDHNVNTVSIDGEHKNTVVNKGQTIIAKWLGLGQGNRLTPPNVRIGETVMLYNFAGYDMYFWDIMATEFEKRTEDKMILAVSANNTKGVTDPNSMYFIALDSFSKAFQIHTSNINGELTTYDITIDTKKGSLTIEDGRGNYMQIDSAKQDLNINMNNDAKVTIGNNVNTTIATNETKKVGSNIDITAGSNIKQHSGSNTNITTGGILYLN